MNIEDSKKHWCSRHPLYKKWNGMMTRCYNNKHDSYYRYGGRGILVCKQWHDVRNFIADMEPTYTEGYWLDRIDNDKNYSPDNCKWTTPSQNLKNTSRSRHSDLEHVKYHHGAKIWRVIVLFKTKKEAEAFAVTHIMPNV